MRTWTIILGLAVAAAMAGGCSSKERAAQQDSESKADEPMPKIGAACRVFFKAEVVHDQPTMTFDKVTVPSAARPILEGKLHAASAEWIALDVPASGPEGFNRLWIAKDSVMFVQTKE